MWEFNRSCGPAAALALWSAAAGAAPSVPCAPDNGVYPCRLMRPRLPADEVIEIVDKLLLRSCGPGDRIDRTSPCGILPADEIGVLIAARDDTPVVALALLAVYPADRVREAVASNPHTPLRPLADLGADPSAAVRRAVAGHPGTSLKVLAALARDEDCEVRRLVWENPASRKYKVSAVIRDPAPGRCEYEIEVRDEDWARDFDRAGDPQTPPDRLAALAGAGDPLVREAVAANPAASPQLLWRLSQDPDQRVRVMAAAHPALDPGRMLELRDDPDYGVRLSLAGNPALPPTVAERLADEHDAVISETLVHNPGVPPQTIRKIAADDRMGAAIRGEAEQRLEAADPVFPAH